MNSTNDWGQFIDLEKGLYISDKSTGVVNSHVKQEVMERNNLPFVQTINRFVQNNNFDISTISFVAAE